MCLRRFLTTVPVNRFSQSILAARCHIEIMTESGFRCLSINTDMPNRKAAAKGDKLYPAVLNVATREVGTPVPPSFIAIQEIGPRIGGKLLKHCAEHYEGIVRPISYDLGILMWRRDRWIMKSSKDINVSEMGHYMSVKLHDVSTEKRLSDWDSSG